MLFFFTIFREHNNNCSIDLYNRDLKTTIILFTRNLSSDKTDWILSELPLPDLPCILYRRVSSLINAFEAKCLCFREVSIDVNKLFIVVCVFCLRCSCSIVVTRQVAYSLFSYIDVVAIFLFIRFSSQQVYCFVFGAFVYHFKLKKLKLID